jgi:hypothetical protein
MIVTAEDGDGESRVALVSPDRDHPLYWMVRTEPQQEIWVRRPLWHYRRSVTGLMDRHGIDRDTAAEVYRERD